MHLEQLQFCKSVRRRYPWRFVHARVLDVGSLDVNGTNRYLFRFTGCRYTGLDLGPGPNVDVVTPVHLYDAPPASFDIVVSTEAMEHDPYLPLSLRKMADLVRPNGLLLFTCATTGRPEHGTSTTSAADSPHTPSYYRNVTPADVRGALDLEALFKKYELSEDHRMHDLRFFGIRR
jgi:SAM-dependent methyltransferase